MKHKLSQTIVVLGVLLLSACNFLDIVPEKNETVDYAFGERKRAIGYLATVYSFIPQIDDENSGPRSLGPESYQYLQARNNGNNITIRGNSVTNPLLNYWDGGGGVATGDRKDLFTALRCCNIFLENVYNVPDLSNYERDIWAAEVKFLKAFYHWWLVQLYGPIPTIRENLPIGASTEDVMVFRDPLDETVDYIIQLMDEAIEFLPDVVLAEQTDLGRVTKPAAMAMKAKILTYYASPFYNGNAGYINFKDKRGVRLFPDKDNNKWIRAAEACKEAIEYCESLGYVLYEYQTQTGESMTDSTRHLLSIQGMVTEPWNKELLWGLSTAATTEVARNCMPFLINELFSYNWHRARFSPTLSTVETFYSSHGVPIEEDNEWISNGWYNQKYETAIGDADHRFVIKEGETTARLHFNREYRFYSSVTFDRGLWYGNIIPSPSETNQTTVLGRAGEVSGKRSIERFSITGYLVKKLVHTSATGTSSSFSTLRYPWPIMRLADLYLLYAEALNETLPGGPDAEVFKYINKVRARAGLEDVEASWSNWSNNPNKYRTQSGMRDIIHQERMNELAFEGHYYFDIRRWSGGTELARYDIMTLNNLPIRGWNIDGITADEYYVIRTVEALTYSFRDYLWPIKESTLIQNTNLVQNPGW